MVMCTFLDHTNSDPALRAHRPIHGDPSASSEGAKVPLVAVESLWRELRCELESLLHPLIQVALLQLVKGLC